MIEAKVSKEPAGSQETQQVSLLYILTSTTRIFEDIGSIEVYGIEIRFGNINEKVEDISSNKKLVTSLLHKFVLEQCSPFHLKDVVEDFLIDYRV